MLCATVHRVSIVVRVRVCTRARACVRACVCERVYVRAFVCASVRARVIESSEAIFAEQIGQSKISYGVTVP